jgi:hypothetical protein
MYLCALMRRAVFLIQCGNALNTQRGHTDGCQGDTAPDALGFYFSSTRLTSYLRYRALFEQRAAAARRRNRAWVSSAFLLF